MLELKVHDDDREVVLQFEHSLLSLSKWESRTKKPFMTSQQKTPTELIDYFKDMLLSPVDPNYVLTLEPEQMDTLAKYINEPQTASKVPQQDKTAFNDEVITSELIYFWLTAMKIPFVPTEEWHISRVMMLVQITNFKNQPAKRRKPAEVMQDWRAINERQKKMLGTSG